VIDARNIKKMEISRFDVDYYYAIIQLVGNGLVSCTTPPDVVSKRQNVILHNNSKRQDVILHNNMMRYIKPVDGILRVSQVDYDDSITPIYLHIDRVQNSDESGLDELDLDVSDFDESDFAGDSAPLGKFLHEYEFGMHQTEKRHINILRLAYGSKEHIQYQAWICIKNGSEIVDLKFRDGLKGVRYAKPVFRFGHS
jgi:hypothetical protein